MVKIDTFQKVCFPDKGRRLSKSKLVCAKILNRNIGRAQKFAFRKSGCAYLWYIYFAPLGLKVSKCLGSSLKNL